MLELLPVTSEYIRAMTVRTSKSKTARTKTARTKSRTTQARSPLAPFTRMKLKKRTQAVLIGVSERTLGSIASGEKPSEQTKRRVAESARLLRALAEIMDEEFVREWLHTPNEAFDGLKPLEVVERGEGDRVWQMIYRLRSGEPA